MRYIDVEWHHKNPDEPYRLISEIGEDNFETRKLEFFKDGKIGVATKQIETLDTRLGITEIPNLAEINSDTQFTGKEITEDKFYVLWQKYGHGDS